MMSCLLAKIKRKRAVPYRKITSDQSVFEEVDFSNITNILYTPDYKLDDDEWFKIESFDQTPYCLDLFKNSFDPKEYNDIEKEEFEEISYLVSFQNNCFYVQNITPSSFIRLKTIAYGDLPFGEVSKIVDDNKQIFIKKIPDAIYEIKSKSLLFRDLSMITSIFNSIGDLYKEATKAEVDSFLQQSFIKPGNGYKSEKVSVLNRRLINVAMAAVSKLSVAEREKMFDYVNDYCASQIVFDAKKKHFEVNNDSDLKHLLYGIHQRFYTTPFGKEKMLANSVKPM
jgi:hypothetical protein